MALAKEFNAFPRSLLAFRGLDPGASDSKTNAVVTRIGVVATNSAVVTGIARPAHDLFRFAFISGHDG